jgi:hypothetical protein
MGCDEAYQHCRAPYSVYRKWEVKRRQIPPEHWYRCLSIKLDVVTSKKTIILIFTIM